MAHDSTLAEQRREAIHKLQALIRGVRVAMLTTIVPDGGLRSRPMETAHSRFDGDLWFFTAADSPKVAEIVGNPQVNLSYAEPEDERYVSLSGTAHLVRDPKRIEVLWDDELRPWFPQGLEDPQLALLQVSVERAEYWDAPANSMVQLGGLVKRVVTGREAAGSHEKIEFPQ
jgi:general stress protein 26